MDDLEKINHEYVVDDRAILATAVGQAKIAIKLEKDSQKALEILERASVESAALREERQKIYEKAQGF